jgi:nicotinamidase-related amidase
MSSYTSSGTSSQDGPTAIVLIDLYNDFLHPEGKLFNLLSATLKEHDAIAHLHQIVATARKHHIPIYYGLHQQWKPGFYQGWEHMAHVHHSQEESHAFAEGSWGAQILEGLGPDVLGNGDVVVSKHWNSSSFQSTDLDFQLRQRKIENLVLAGMTANTCLESTSRYAYELGYHVTMLKDATAGWNKEQVDAATEMIWPLFASKVTTTGEWIKDVEEGKGE